MQPVLPGVGAFVAVEQQDSVLIDTREDTGRGNGDQAVIGDNDQVGIGNDAAFVDRQRIGAHVGKYRRATAFGTITRRILDLIAF